MDTLLNREIKGYEIRERLGAGGFGAVYRAYQPSVGREVAIKVILPQYANQPDFVRRFEVEAQVVARLEHPHIVPLYDYWRDPQGAYLVMRWLRSNLRASLERSSWSLEAAARLLEQVGAALTVAHREGIVHRDIKPDNILLDEDENAYLADFGIAKDMHLRSPQHDDEVAGSPAYLSPEQIRSDEVTARTDLYSLGYVLYELLTGEKPFADAKTPSDYIMKHLSDPMPMLSIQHTHIPAAIDEVLQTVTAKDPSHRYANAQRFASAFRAALPNRLPRSVSQPLADPLTERELEVLRLMIEGIETQEIAQRLFLTVSTVRWYIKQVYSKLDAHSRQQAIERALSLKLTEPPAASKVSSVLLDQPTVQGIEPVIRIIDPENPFKGLRAFQERDSIDFFGRALLTERLLSRLSEGGDGVRFLAIVGPSGSGKSSVVRAGLIPALRKGALSVSSHPFIADFMPGTHPLEELEAALLRVAVNPMPGLLEQLRQDRRGLVRAAKRLLPNDNETELVLVIDQFEEVFTLVTDEALRSHFIDNLLAAASDPRGRVRIIITLRADFYDRPLLYPRLAEIVRVNTEVIIPLTAREMEQAITAPLERVGMTAESGLTATILHDIGEQPGTLPLLQYTLTELFERREGLTLTLDAYKATGGVLGALARRAEDIYNSLDEQSQALTRQLFLRMVTLGEGTEDTRRRVLQAELATLGNETILEDVLNAFGQYRLLTLDRDPLTHGPTVEIAHEALIREWSRLREWLNESREEIRLQRQLMMLADDWQASHEEVSYLLRGARLEIFEKWSRETTLALTEHERTYLDASLVQQHKEQVEEEMRYARELELAQEATQQAQKAAESAKQAATHQQSAANRLRQLVVVMALAVIGALILSGVALTERQSAENARSTSEANFSEAQELSLVNGAQAALASGNGDLARALAVVANNVPNPSGQAQIALADAAYSPGTVRVFQGHAGRVENVSFSPDGQLALTTSASGDVYVWDVSTGEVVHQLQVADGSETHSAVFNFDASLVAVGHNADVILYDAATGERLRIFSGHSLGVTELDFSPDGRTVVAGSWDDTLIQWDVASGAVTRILEGHTGDVNRVIFSPDGTRIVSTSADNTFILWDTATGSIIHRFDDSQTMFNDGVLSVAYSRDGSMIAVSAFPSTLTLWDADTFNLIRRFELDDIPIDLAFTHDNQKLLIEEGNNIILFDITTAEHLITLRGHTSFVPAVALSPDGRYVLSGSEDRSVRLWDLHHGAEVTPSMQAPGWGANLALSVDGNYILVSSHSGANHGNNAILTLYDATSGTEIRRFGDDGTAYSNVVALSGWMYLPVTLSPDGRNALSAAVVRIGEDEFKSSVNLWDIDTGTMLREYLLPTNPTHPSNNGYFVEDITSLQFSPDGSRFVAVGRDGMVMLWDVHTGDLVRALGFWDGSYSAIFSPDGHTILTGETSGSVSLWDVESGNLIRRFGAEEAKHGVRVRALAITNDGRYAASGSDDGTLILWDVESGALLHRFVGHQGIIWSIAFSGDGTMLLSGSFDTNVILWDVASGEAVRQYAQDHSVQVGIYGIRLSPDGHSFYALTGSGLLHHWRLESQSDLLAWTYTNRYVPELTCTEREVYRLQLVCVDEIYPTRTPYTVPTFFLLPTRQLFDVTLTPMLTTTFRLAHLGDNRGVVADNSSERWLYHGIAGEILTFRVTADNVASLDFPYQDTSGNPTLTADIILYTANGVQLTYTEGILFDPVWNPLIENYVLPATGDYWIEVSDSFVYSSGGAYTLTIEHGELPPEATPEVTATP